MPNRTRLLNTADSYDSSLAVHQDVILLPAEDGLNLEGALVEGPHEGHALCAGPHGDGSHPRGSVGGTPIGAPDQGMLRRAQAPLLHPPPPPLPPPPPPPSGAEPSASAATDPRMHEATIKLRGLPYSAGVEEIIEWLSGQSCALGSWHSPLTRVARTR